MFLVLIISLVAAGIFTHAIIWYIFAGMLVGLYLFVTMVALIGAVIAIKKTKRSLGDVDDWFKNDFFKPRH